MTAVRPIVHPPMVFNTLSNVKSRHVDELELPVCTPICLFLVCLLLKLFLTRVSSKQHVLLTKPHLWPFCTSSSRNILAKMTRWKVEILALFDLHDQTMLQFYLACRQQKAICLGSMGGYIVGSFRSTRIEVHFWVLYCLSQSKLVDNGYVTRGNLLLEEEQV